MNNDNDWQKEGACTGHPDPDLWHYNNTNIADEQQLQVLRSVEAIETCRTCKVQEECLREGMKSENLLWSIGGNGSVWGGKLTSERAILMGHEPTHNAVRHERRHARDVRARLGRISG